MLIVATIGVSGSGKTTTIEYLISQLSKLGYQIGTIKHIHHKGFTIDKEGTNTWRYAQAGSKVIVAISPEEIDVIKKIKTELNNLDQIITSLEQEKLDIVFIEGFHNIIAKKANIWKIVTAKDLESLEQTLERTVKPILAITGVFSKNTSNSTYNDIPLIRIPEQGQELVRLVKQQLEEA